MSPAAGAAVLDQLAGWLGGWSYDWDAGYASYRRTVAGEADAADAARALVFVHRSHALQSAMLARAEGAEPPLRVAALLHDIGHSFAAPAPAGREAGYDDKHEVIGALWLAQVFVDEVAPPVLHHVAAKRYLVATRPDYAARLAPDSVLSLAAQGGGMSRDEIAAFETLPGWREAVRLRVWDDAAKEWSLRFAPLDSFRPELLATLRS